MSKNLKQKEGIKSKHDFRDPETKQRDRIYARCWRTRNKTKELNPGVIPENPKKKGMDRIRARCRRTWNKRKGSNQVTMSENSKQKEGIESGRKGRDRIQGRCPRTRNKKKGLNLSTMPENPKQKKGSKVFKGANKGLCPCLRHQYHVRNPPLHIKSKSQSLKYYKHSFLRKSPPHKSLTSNIHQQLIGGMPLYVHMKLKYLNENPKIHHSKPKRLREQTGQ